MGDRARAKPGGVADEPKALEEALRLYRPKRALQGVGCSQVFRKGAEVCVLPRIAGRRRRRRNDFRPCLVVAVQSKLVEKLAHGVAKVLSLASAGCHVGKGLTELSGWGRV